MKLRRSKKGLDGPILDMTKSRERESTLTTRRKAAWWDRIKILALLGFIFSVMWAQNIGSNPIKPYSESFLDTADSLRWIVYFFIIEAVRQTHYFISEHWSWYYRVWRNSIFGRVGRWTEKINPWTRFRVGRAFRWAFFISLLSILFGSWINEPAATALLVLPSRAWASVDIWGRLVIVMLFLPMQFVLLFWFLSRGGVDTYFPDDIDTRFDDVWGQDGVLDKVRENLLFLEDPERIESRGGYAPGGILLWGPPGTGKTLMAEAAAGETGKPFVFVDPGAFNNMFMGVGVLKVKGLFRKLRKLALRYGGVVVFFDEADVLGNRGLAQGAPNGYVPNGFEPHGAWQHMFEAGSSLPYLSEGAQAEIRQAAFDESLSNVDPPERRKNAMMMGMGGGGAGTLQALLTEISGLKKPRGFFNRTVRKLLGMRPKPPPKYRILIMMASNMPGALDSALLRPGRIDRIYKVGYPTKEGRKRTYQGYFDKVPHTLVDDDFEMLSTITPYATGAVIKDMVNEALINAIRDGREIITWGDVIKAKQLKEHGLADDFEYVERERHAVAIHEACHALVAHRLRVHMRIDTATIERRGDVGGFVASIPPEDRFTHWRSEYETDIQVGLASLAGERMFFDGDNSSGVGGDLRTATHLSLLMVGTWGMGTTLSSHAAKRSFGVGGQGGGGGRGDEDDPTRELLRSSIAGQAETKLGELMGEVTELLEANRHEILCVAHALEWHRTMIGDDVAAVIDGTQGVFIDGREYHTDEARAELEDYHAAAVVAHKRNTPVDADLPVIGVEDPKSKAIPATAASINAHETVDGQSE